MPRKCPSYFANWSSSIMPTQKVGKLRKSRGKFRDKDILTNLAMM
jgi:hypothetical protein